MIDDRTNSVEREAMRKALQQLKQTMVESGMTKQYCELECNAILNVLKQRLNTKIQLDIFILLLEYEITIAEFGELYTSLKIVKENLDDKTLQLVIETLKNSSNDYEKNE